MSVIAWDGRMLAADRMSTSCEMRMLAAKARRTKTGQVVAWTGDLAQGIWLAEWYENGARRDGWPDFQKGDGWTRLIVASAGGVEVYERLPVPIPVLDKFMAWGSGRDFAMGAMGMGADAVRAVEVASIFATGCGSGVDSYLLGVSE